jgi:predicted nucleotidyltransferase
MTPRHDGRRNALDDTAFPSDFRDFIRALNAHRVEYVVVGGYAVGYHGHIRATSDIDFFYRRTSVNVTRLILALADFGAPGNVMDAAHLASPEAVAGFGEPPHRIELLAGISGVTYEEAAHEAIEMEIHGDLVPIIGLDALRRNKRASGRKKDRDDLRRLATVR